jgi:hypothetical protein
MTWREFIADLVSTLVWPAVAASFLRGYRKQVRLLLGRIAKFKVGPVESGRQLPG